MWELRMSRELPFGAHRVREAAGAVLERDPMRAA
jgi:hypothetical protein